MELYTGRPADCAGRLDKELRVYDLLEHLVLSQARLPLRHRGTGNLLKSKSMVDGDGFEPSYLVKESDLQSDGFNHSPTRPTKYNHYTKSLMGLQ